MGLERERHDGNTPTPSITTRPHTPGPDPIYPLYTPIYLFHFPCRGPSFHRQRHRLSPPGFVFSEGVGLGWVEGGGGGGGGGGCDSYLDVPSANWGCEINRNVRCVRKEEGKFVKRVVVVVVVVV
ncbi:hypothetical protein Pcinc_034152 [Petrolisthes cinctipes]|uniref:Uncharacterized protein n=1 Tax=Petrolisthes cinctipes TaxID=88211 RepID=A0AAE1EQT2_PETCI|nr:hypothetical protein Pcinc_034152 [Petrolisthes cinctipes]